MAQENFTGFPLVYVGDSADFYALLDCKNMKTPEIRSFLSKEELVEVISMNEVFDGSGYSRMVFSSEIKIVM